MEYYKEHVQRWKYHRKTKNKPVWLQRSEKIMKISEFGVLFIWKHRIAILIKPRISIKWITYIPYSHYYKTLLNRSPSWIKAAPKGLFVMFLRRFSTIFESKPHQKVLEINIRVAYNSENTVVNICSVRNKFHVSVSLLVSLSAPLHNILSIP